MSVSRYLLKPLLSATMLCAFAVAAQAETRLVITYDEAYEGIVSVNGKQVGTIISHGVYEQVSNAVKASRESGTKLDRGDLLKEQAKADKANLDGIGSNVMMTLRLEYVLDPYLAPGENQVDITFKRYTSANAQKFGYTGRGFKDGPNELRAAIWSVNGDQGDLLDYKTHLAKPSAQSAFGAELSDAPASLRFALKR